MKNLISFLVSIIIVIVIILNMDVIIDAFKNIDLFKRKIIVPEANHWDKEYDFLYFKETDSFIPNNYEELVSIFYTTLDKGWKEFTFYCGDEYTNCLNDVATLSYDQKFLSEMNNFVHPYNSYSTIKTLYDTTGEITIKIDKIYSDEEIITIDKDIDELMNKCLKDNMSTRDKIKKMHDIIIKNTKYDQERADNNSSPYDSARIQGILYQNYGICSAYTDLMAVILSKLEIPNFKISSDEHVWNALYIDNKWYHLDLTWDDPISTSGRDVLLYDYFIITDNTLTKLDKNNNKIEHIYNKNIYLEFN